MRRSKYGQNMDKPKNMGKYGQAEKEKRVDK